MASTTPSFITDRFNPKSTRIHAMPDEVEALPPGSQRRRAAETPQDDIAMLTAKPRALAHSHSADSVRASAATQKANREREAQLAVSCRGVAVVCGVSVFGGRAR